jgi:2-keto-4-pentenoate hydratase/2-oxohepta-3-ene-1,7-dioic acid hydratase in catechol pathway
MRIIRYRASGQIHLGEERDGKVFRLEGEIFGPLTPTSIEDQPEEILAPLDPTMIIGIGQNYQKHAEEQGSNVADHPVVFFKALNSVCGQGAPIRLPRILKSTKVDYEAELAVVIGRDCLNATKENALDFVLGVTCGNDVSARDWQKEWGGGQWSRAKSFDTFCPLGPVLVTLDELPNPNGLAIKSRLNGVTVQDWTTSDMIFDVPTLIEFLSGDTTLPAGTVIMTGTPHGVGMARTPPLFMKAGDVTEVEIEGIGVLSNPVE